MSRIASMRRHLFSVLAVAAAVLAAPVGHAYAQGRDADPDAEAAAKKKKDSEWDTRQAPLPGMRNAGPCPYVKVLYDAARYVELDANRAATNAVGYSGEIQSLSAGCRYTGVEPIHLEIELLFALGKGPRATSDTKSYPYWVAVTDRNRSILAKEYFTLPVKFPAGSDRVLVTQRIGSIDIPRANKDVSGSNFEVLIGFDVTPEMAEFNRDGKRFRVNAGTTTAAAAPTGAPAAK
jgi:hypothetical protein